MFRIDHLSGRLISRGASRGLLGRVRLGVAALGLSGSLACGQAGLVEPEVPVQHSHLLAASASGRVRAEVLHANVEVLGLEIASLDSTTCTVASGGATVETQVEPAALVKAFRSSGGQARTELGSGVVPASSDYTFRDGDIVRHYQVDYRAGGYAYVYDNGGIERRPGNNSIPEGAEPHDMHSALLLLRAWRPRLDEAAYFYVVLGRRPWRVDVTSRGPEMIKLGDDPRLTSRIDGVAVRIGEGPGTPTKHFSLWLSEGAERVPLRMVADASLGPVTMTLTGREAGERECAPAASARAPRPPLARPPVAPPVNAPVGLIGSAWSSPRPARP
jgi:Protein of unknown function (DUF3108)